MMRFRIYRQLIPKIGLLMLAIIFSSHLSAQYRVTIENGGTTVGPFSATPAAFGSVTSGCGDEVVGMGDTPIDFETGDPTLCNGASGAVSVEGKIAFIDRGGCEFGQKCLSAQRAGAIAVVVCNNVADPPTIIMAGGAVGDQVTIPCFMVSQEDCVALRAALEGGTVTLEPDLPVFNEDDRVIWGDVEGQGDFSGGFNDWATVGVTTMFGEQETVPVEWQWGTEFPAPLAPPAIEAPSTCDGSVIFDSQSLIDLESDDPLSFYAGFLISPVIDLSASVDPILSFYQFHIPLNGVAAVQYTVDGGESFSEFIIVDTENELNSNVTNIVGTELVEIPYPELAGESQVQFLFLCISDAYFWVVDDVRVIERNTLAADPTALNVGAMAGTDTVNIDANIAWTASVDEDWLTISPTSGSTDAQLVIEYQDNDSRRNSRTATITVSSNEGLVDPVTITVNQERLRNFVRVNPDTVTVDMLAGSTSFAVESDQLWSAAESESWLSISPNSGFGDGAVDVNYDENTADTARVGMIEVSSVSGSTAVFVLIQEGAGIQEMISADPTDINVDASAGEAEIRVSSNTNWVASGGDEWISYAPSTGEGDDVITVKYDENTALDSRQTSITLSTGAGEMVTVTITQAGAAPFIAVDPMMLNVGNGEGDASVAVNANENWTASSDSEWLIVTPEAGSGSTGAIVGYLENLSLDARTGTITFTAASGGIATVIVNQDGRPRTTVVDVVVNSDVHETLEAAVIAAELAGTLSGEGPFTVFAPTDDAFGALPEGTLETLLADPTGDLANILLYHVLGAKVLSTDLMDGQVATTLLGEDVTVTINEDGVFINDAQVTVADIETDNGVVHVIDAVLLPPPPLPATVVDIVVNSEVHETLEAAVIAAELADDLSGEGPFTVFAPTDDAFAALPEGTVETLLEDPTGDLANILLYHVLGAKVLSTDLMDGQVATTLLGEDITVTINEDGVFINDAQVTVADIEAENGVVHVIDAVLLPPPALPATVVDIIVESEVHETLEAAVIAAELADDLSGEGPFTVFAPTDDAFAALPEGTVEMLLEDPTGDLANILLYHVLGVKVLSTDLTDGQTAMTLEGSDITVTINDDGVFINGAQVIVADLEAENGVVHVIDAVLIPPVDCDEVVEGGTVALEDGTTEATIIAGDGVADVLSFMSMGAAEDANFTYVITDDQNTILGIPPSNMQDFEGAGPGICRVWGLSYTGEITAMGGDNAAEVDLSSECFELSSNFITVTREEFMLPATVVDIVVNSDVHNTLEAAVIAAELADDLSGEGPFTVFAPTDDAFAALPEGTVETLLEDPTGDLANILLYHVLGAKVLSTDLSDGQVATTLLGEDITVTINDDGVFINNAQVIVADLEAQNGVVHVIDAVLLPPDPCEGVVDGGTVALEDGSTEATVTVGDGVSDFLSFTSMGANADANFAYVITDDLNNILGIPDNNMADFDNAGPGVCRVWGLSYTGQVTALPGDNAGEVALSSECFALSSNFITVNREEFMLPATVVDIVVNSEVHETLEAAVIAAELADDLSGEGPFTVFAPTDDAFAALPEGTVETLLEDPTGDLANILLYHVLGAKVLSTDLSDGQVATTLLGEDITVTINDDGVFINNAQVIVADIEAENGVVHVIDAVLLPPPALPATVVDIIVESEVHNTLEAAVIAAELADDLSGEGPFTVFAPTDDAFAALPEGTVETLLEDPTGDLANILLYHVLGAKVLSTDLTDGQTAMTLEGSDITVMINDDGVFINDAQVIIADLEAENGVVHVIDAVLIPPVDCDEVVEGGTVALEDGSTEATIIAGDGVADVLSFMSMGAAEDANFTYVITDDQNVILGIPPSNMQDFEGAGPGICRVWGLSYTGEIIAMGGDNAGEVDLSSECFELSSNFITVTREEFMLPATVVDIVVNSEVHETLEAAVIAAELADDLSGEGPFTVFAPTDDAFAALPEGTVEALLEDPTGDLANILLYHVLGAKVLSTDLSDGQVATTLLGEDITVTINDDGVFINNAQVIVADIEAQNGVVHVIDAVLLPPDPLPETVVDIIVDSEIHTILETAVGVAGLADDLSGEGPFTVFAPTDDAFAALPDGVLDALLEEPTGDLANILLYHVLGAKVLSTDLTDGQVATTLLGEDITVTINDDGVFINNAQVILADLEAENGVVHVIDAVLLPPDEVDCDEVVEGGTVALEDGSTEATIIAGDGVADVLSFMSMGAAEDANFTYVITDDQNVILGIPPSNMQDFEGAGPGICRVWGLSYTGEITAMGGDNAAEVDLSSECFELSSNFITVTREEFMLPATVVDIVVNSEIHETLEAAVIAAELADDLSGEGPFTVFAPTDDAFAALPEGTVEALLQDPTGDLANILLYHVLGAKVLSTDLMDGQVATTLLGEDITVTINDDGVFINDAQVIVADLEAQNGVVHVIDAVLLPPADDPCEGVVDGGTVALDDGSTEATIIVDGEPDVLTFMSMGANADANFTYVITDDQNVILGIPPSNTQDFDGAGPGICRVWGLSYTGEITAMAGDNAAEVALSDDCFDLSDNFITVTREEERGDLPATVVEIIQNSDDHKTLEVALILADLIDDLSGEGPFTVFAPTDAAFSALPSGLLDKLLTNASDGRLGNILLYHVLAGKVLSSDLSDGQVATTLLGEDITVTIDADGNVFINDAQVTIADIEAENGVVHVIDAVLVPDVEESSRFLEIRPPSRVVNQEAGETVFVVFSNTDWSISTDAADVEFFPSVGSGTRFVKVVYGENMEGPAREVVLNVESTTGESGQFTLTQSGTDDFIAVSPENIFVRAVQGSTSFDLVSSTDWTLSTDADWITLTTGSGSGNASVSVDYASNGAFEIRTGTITATTPNGATASINISQGASEDVEVFFELRPPSREVSGAAGEVQFVIFTNAIWNISTDADWVEFFGTEGQGTAFIKVPYGENTTGEARTAELDVVTSTGETGVFTLTQTAEGAFIINNPTIDATATIANFDLTLYPNPVSSLLNIRIDADEDRAVDVQVLDVNGKVVKYYNSQPMFSGENTIQIDVDDLTSGIYYFRMLGQDVVKQTKFIVAH